MKNLTHNLYIKTIALVAKQRILFLELGEVLYEIKSKQLYKKMGDGGFDTWKSFLANPEIDLSVQMADIYVRIYEYYILELKKSKEEIQHLPILRLNRLLPKLENATPEEREEWLDKAKLLSYTDFIQELREGATEELPAPYFIRHNQCGRFQIRYHEETLCSCKGEEGLTNLSLKK